MARITDSTAFPLALPLCFPPGADIRLAIA
jgi:hypothetical protein